MYVSTCIFTLATSISLSVTFSNIPKNLKAKVSSYNFVFTKIFPIIKPLKVRIRLTEKFQFHLFKFPGTEREIPRRNLVTEAFADLGDAERDLFSRGALDICKIDKNSLRRLRPKVQLVFRILRHALERFEHQVELPDLRKIRPATGRAFNLMLLDVLEHLVV